MSKTIYNKDNGELDGSTETVDRENKQRSHTILWQYHNSLNQDATITIYGTNEDDTSFSEAVQIGQTTVSSGGNADYDTMTDPWDRIQLEISYTGDPTSGDIQIYEMARR